jgi:hypothetical protein
VVASPIRSSTGVGLEQLRLYLAKMHWCYKQKAENANEPGSSSEKTRHTNNPADQYSISVDGGFSRGYCTILDQILLLGYYY